MSFGEVLSIVLEHEAIVLDRYARFGSSSIVSILQQLG